MSRQSIRKARNLDRLIREGELFAEFIDSGQTAAGFAAITGINKRDFARLCQRVKRREKSRGWTLAVLRRERTRRQNEP